MTSQEIARGIAHKYAALTAARAEGVAAGLEQAARIAEAFRANEAPDAALPTEIAAAIRALRNPAPAATGQDGRE